MNGPLTSRAPRAPVAHKLPRLQWHRLYYILAAFDLFTVLFSLAINHQIRGQFARSVAVNQMWAQRLADYSELGYLAQSVNAPGNDVFDSRAVVAESVRLRTARNTFDGRLAELRQEVQTVHGPAQPILVADFDAVADAMDGMTNEADLIFSYFEQNQPDMAGRRMATMDRQYAGVTTALAHLRDDVATIQQANLDEQDATAQSLAKFDVIMAAFVGLMITAATVYGHKMARRVQADAREHERYLDERNRGDEERARLYAELAEREHRLEDLVGRLLLAQEEERRRIAYEIHDGLAQVAAAAQQHLEAFAGYCRPRSQAARHELQQALELSCRTVREARRVIGGLRPTVLDDFGLAHAIRLEVEALTAEGWGVTYREALGPDRLPPLIETALFRVGQEALRNVRKHAGPTRVAVSLHRRGACVRLAVQDWGRGFRPASVVGTGPSERVGLAGMQERIALLGGNCAVTSRPGFGTRVLVNLPIVSEAETAHAA